MIAIEIDAGQLKRLADAAAAAGKKMATELAGAINSISKKTKLNMAREILDITVHKTGDVKPAIKIEASATSGKLEAIVSLKKTRRLGLKHFKAKQDATGVSYQIEKGGKRLRSEGSFMGKRPGRKAPKLYGNAARRTSPKRLPIIVLKGVSAWGAYRHHNLTGPQVEATRAELFKQIERRINFNVLRASGIIKH